MHFRCEIVGAYWQEESGEWLVKIEQTNQDGTTKDIEERCNLLLYGSGILNNYKWPKIEGIEEIQGQSTLSGLDQPHFR